MNANLEQVSNNSEKSITYKTQMQRFKLAREQGFLFEAIFILYAMLEDRLSSFLYHAGLTNCNRDKITTNQQVRPQINEILLSEPKEPINFSRISHKIKIIQRIFSWSANYIYDNLSSDYKDLLTKQIIQSNKSGEIPELLVNILDWTKSRNELVHALMNKKVENQTERLQQLIADGYGYCRTLDAFVKSFSNHSTNLIRKQFNIQ